MYCPGWVYDISVARVASEFVSSELGVEAFANKYSAALSERYNEIKSEELSEAANGLLQFLAEIEAGDQAVVLIENYIYSRLYFEQINRPRKMKPMFGSVDDPVKEKEHSAQLMLKSFRAHVFGMRSNATPNLPAGWRLEDDENIPFLSELASEQVSILDAL